MKKWIFLMLIFATTPSAHAMLDLRGHVGVDIVDPQKLNDALDSLGVKNYTVLPRFGGAAYFNPLPIGLGIGAQFDSQNVKMNAKGSGTNETELNTTRVTLKAYFHLFDSILFAGPVVGVGVYHTGDLELKVSGETVKYDKSSSSSGSLGWEMGYNVGPIRVGGEAGYQFYKLTSVKNASDSLGVDIDLSGGYVFGFVGIAF